MITGSEASSLFEIARIWERYYKIELNSADGIWIARRLGRSMVPPLTADTPEMLRALIAEDFKQWQREARKASTI